MNFKRYIEASDTWVDSHYIHKTDTDILTTLPDVIYVNDNNATVGLKGNMEQSSGVSPTTPIQPSECGERTGNLLPEFYATSGEISGNSYTITENSIETHNDGSVLGSYFVLTEFKRGSNYANYILIDEKHSFRIPAGTYTFSANEKKHSLYNGLCLIVGQLGKSVSGATSGAEHIYVGQTFTINEDSYVCPILEIRSDSHVDEYILTNPMLNSGSTPLPYKPYGYKIPILNNSQTTDVYLGEVETTRKIYKFELTGEETWTRTSVGKMYSSDALNSIPNYNHALALTTMCSHYKSVANAANTLSLGLNEMCLYGTKVAISTKEIYIYPDGFSTADDFKTYLAQQYANGTPVCIWYVLATPQTAVVNEPLRKIGTYADEVSGITIPVTAGENTLSIGTTLQPSEITVNYHGWHPVANVHEAENGQWD